VYGVCPPGRGPRIGQPSFTRLPDLVASLLNETRFVSPFVLFGHSLGALVAFETARALRAGGDAMPQRLVVSAHAAPHLPRKPTRWHALSDIELMSVLNDDYDGIPDHVAADPDLMALSLPALRADLTLLDDYRYQDEEALAVPIDAFLGEADTVPSGRITQWKMQTMARFREYRFAGGHFYFRDADIFGVLRDLLQP
jgi:surfactin synthase thioesterase subunit